METTYNNGKRETSYMMTDLERWEYNHRNTIQKVELGATAAGVVLWAAGAASIVGFAAHNIRKYGIW